MGCGRPYSTQMRILIEAASAREGGGQTYLINLLQRVPADASLEILLVCPDSLNLKNVSTGVRRLDAPKYLENPFLRALWKFWVLPKLLRDNDIDVLFCPGGMIGTIPPIGCKTVTVFQNMMPFDLIQRKKYPLGYMRLRHWLLERAMTRSMEAADLLIFISNTAKAVIDSKVHKPLKRTAVIPHGLSEKFRRSKKGKLDAPVGLPLEGYFLYVSTLDFYKAQIEVVQGFAILKEKRKIKQKLLLVGPQNSQYAKRLRQEISRLKIEDDVIVLGKIPYESLPAVYQNADINIFASECENCPNILLEGLASGVPTLCSDRAPMPEFGESAVLYFTPSKPEDFANKMGILLDSESERVRLAGAAIQQAKKFDWEIVAEKTWREIAALGSLK